VCVDDALAQEPPADPARPGPVRILSLGHVTEMRSRCELLRVVADLRRAGHNVRLTIAGKVLTARTQAMIDRLGLAGEAALMGEVPRGPQLFDLFRSSHLEAHWIDMPGIGSAGLEAMALGLPVISYAYEGIYGDVPLRHGENVMLIDPRRPATVHDALHSLASDAALRVQMGQRARCLVREHLTWSVMVKRIRDLYSEVLR
jgi:glycosyltransferase involved in cell wall biosynthesis